MRQHLLSLSLSSRTYVNLEAYRKEAIRVDEGILVFFREFDALELVVSLSAMRFLHRILQAKGHTVHQNLVSLPRVITAPSESGPNMRWTVWNALIISWQNAQVSRFSGGRCRVMMKMLPCRSSAMYLYFGRAILVV
jgi:hypothetical protein